jgi:effector-binding domain-containing protein
MALEFAIEEVEARPTACIRTKTTRDKLGEVMGPMYGDIMAAVQPTGAAPTGMPFARYYEMQGNDVDLECGIPLSAVIEPSGRVAASALPGGRVATVTHVGPYDQLGDAWEAIMGWVQSEGLTPSGAPWEVYVDDPTKVEASELRTQIYVPVQ